MEDSYKSKLAAVRQAALKNSDMFPPPSCLKHWPCSSSRSYPCFYLVEKRGLKLTLACRLTQPFCRSCFKLLAWDKRLQTFKYTLCAGCTATTFKILRLVYFCVPYLVSQFEVRKHSFLLRFIPTDCRLPVHLQELVLFLSSFFAKR